MVKTSGRGNVRINQFCHKFIDPKRKFIMNIYTGGRKKYIIRRITD
jgi:hypothetical protein